MDEGNPSCTPIVGKEGNGKKKDLCTLQAFPLVQQKAPFMKRQPKRRSPKKQSPKWKKKVPSMSSHFEKANQKKALPKKQLECYICNGPHKLVDSPTKKAINKLLADEPEPKPKPKPKAEVDEGIDVIGGGVCHSPAMTRSTQAS